MIFPTPKAIIALAVLGSVGLAVFVGVVESFLYRARSEGTAQRPRLPEPAFEGEFLIPKAEFQPVIDEAEKELAARDEGTAKCRDWADWVGWGGLVIGLVLAVVAALCGYSVKTADQADKDLVEVLRQQKQSRWLVIAVAVLIVVSGFTNTVVQRLGAGEARLANSARDLNDALVNAFGKLYNPDKTSKAETMIALEQLKRLTHKR